MSTTPFMVNIQDLGPSLSDISETHLEIGGGYVGAPTNVMTSGSGYGGAGIQEINAPNISIMDQISSWVTKNPILAIGIGIFGLMMLKPESRGRR